MWQAPFLEFHDPDLVRETPKILTEKSFQFLEAAVEGAANDGGYLVRALPTDELRLDLGPERVRGLGKPERRLAELPRDG
jgi:hypothetical protein